MTAFSRTVVNNNKTRLFFPILKVFVDSIQYHTHHFLVDLMLFLLYSITEILNFFDIKIDYLVFFLNY